MLGYWKRVHERALKDARAILPIESRQALATAAIVAIVAIGVLWLRGWRDAAIDEIAFKGALTASVVILFPLVDALRFISLPPILHKEQDGEIARLTKELEDERSSKLEHNWRPVPGGAEFWIRNVSGRTLDDVEVIVPNFRSADAKELVDAACPLVAEDGSKRPITLNPGVVKYFRFVQIGQSGGRQYLELAPKSAEGPIRVDRRSCGVKITVSGRNVTNRAYNLLVRIQDNSELSVDAWNPKKLVRKPVHVRALASEQQVGA